MQKGLPFELLIKDMLEAEIRRGELGLSSEFIKLYHRKSYPSRDRGREIVVDVSLELFRQAANDPFFVWVWECKDYGDQVPVNDVEEFHAKLEQIGLHKTKGTIACRNGFQSGAVSYAKSKGIGLVRLLPDGSLVRFLESLHPTSQLHVESGLTELNTQSFESLFFGLTTTGLGVLWIDGLVSAELKPVV